MSNHTLKGSKITLVAFGGPSSSGKTTTAKTLQLLIKNTSIVHLDDFYLPDNKIPRDEKTGELNWDCPEAIDFEKFSDYISSLKTGEETVDIKTLEGDIDLKLSESEIESLSHKVKKFEDEIIVFVDGFMLFHDQEILELFDIKLFFYANFDTLKQRRESRKGYNTVEGFWVDPPNYFENIVWPAYTNSHRYLFNQQDVNSDVAVEKMKHLAFSSFKNDNNSKLIELVNWSLDRLQEHFIS